MQLKTQMQIFQRFYVLFRRFLRLPTLEERDHQVRNKLMHIQLCLFRIKNISASGEIDRQCVKGLSEVVEIGKLMNLEQKTDPNDVRQYG